MQWHKKANKWVVGIHHNGKNVHLGLFKFFSSFFYIFSGSILHFK